MFISFARSLMALWLQHGIHPSIRAPERPSPPSSLSPPRLSVSQSISHTGSASDWPVMISSSSYRHPDALTVLMGAFRVSKTVLFSEESVRVHALQSSVYAVKTSCYKFSAECKHVWFGQYKVTV